MLAKSSRFLLAIFALVYSLSGLALPASDVPIDAKLIKPLVVNSQLPAFTVRNADGTPYHVDPTKLDAPTILIFYRGGWCPYCNVHLGALKTAEPKLLALGYKILFLSADRPELLRSSLKEPDVNYVLLSDSRMEAARALGVAFRVDDATVKQYKTYGIDLEKASGETHHQLPVPSVFIVDPQGVIQFVYSNTDYKIRIKPEELVEAASKALKKPVAKTK